MAATAPAAAGGAAAAEEKMIFQSCLYLQEIKRLM